MLFAYLFKSDVPCRKLAKSFTFAHPENRVRNVQWIDITSLKEKPLCH